MSPSSITAPRWLSVSLTFFIWLVMIPLAHGVLPWGISTLAPRYGWRGVPGSWNRLGLLLVAAAAALLIWILVFAIGQIPGRARLGLTPSSLMMRGPYGFSRNPMYVAELGLWLGWSLYFGSFAVLAGFLILLSVVRLIILPREERGLEAAFGEVYREYKRKVRRRLLRNS